MAEPIRIHTAGGDFADDGRDQLDRMMASLKASSSPRLLLHAHGGLVSRAQGDDLADFLDSPFGYEPLIHDGWTTAYLIWESSVREAIRNNQDELAKQSLLIRYVLRLAAWILGDDLFLGRGEDLGLEEAIRRLDTSAAPDLGPVGDDLETAQWVESLADDQLLTTRLADQLRADPELHRLHAQIEAATRAGAAEVADLDAEAIARIAARQAVISTMDDRGLSATERALIGLVVKAGMRVLKRLAQGRDHGTYCTIVEEVLRALYLAKCGAVAWGLMKADTADHFAKGRPGDLLVSGLFDLAKSSKPVRVLFVGHSAGAVFAHHLAHAAVRPPTGLTLDYAFLAPASRIDLAAELLVDKPAGLNHLRAFTMRDAREIKDDLDKTPFGKIYPRSLLYLISGVLEETSRGRSYADAPILGLERHLEHDTGLTAAERKARAKAHALLMNEIVYAPSDQGPGRQCDTHTHGTIDHDSDTLASLISLARDGYKPPP